MSKKNEVLAKKIVDKLGDYEKIVHHPVDPVTNEQLEDETVHKVVVVIGTAYSAVEDTKAGAYSTLAGAIQQQLDDGSLVLSDTWEEDNL
jgi:hypothetical protein